MAEAPDWGISLYLLLLEEDQDPQQLRPYSELCIFSVSGADLDIKTDYSLLVLPLY
jgi:hypothetical protein